MTITEIDNYLDLFSTLSIKKTIQLYFIIFLDDIRFIEKIKLYNLH